ncbi:MAG: cobalamin-dependent protein [Nitrospinaceae bacterium]
MTKNIIRGFIGVKSNDGHDAAILVVADLLKKGGIEVVLGGYDLTVDKFVDAIIAEGVHFAGISSYNGGHIPFFKAVRDRLQSQGCPHIHLIGGGGATITPPDIGLLEKEKGIDKIFQSGEADRSLPYIHAHYDFSVVPDQPEALIEKIKEGNKLSIAAFLNLVEEKARLDFMLQEKFGNLILEGGPEALARLADEPLGENGMPAKTAWERSRHFGQLLSRLDDSPNHPRTWVLGVTGRGGSGKSTLTDELILRFMNDPRNENRKVAILAVDPTSAMSGGALLADRIAYIYSTDKNWVDTRRIFIRSLASRGAGNGIARALPGMIRVLRAAGYDVCIETYGTGQPDAGIVNLVDRAIFVTTADLGDATQIMKEEMLQIPGVHVVLNKSELQGARRVAGLLRRKTDPDKLFLTTAIEHNNPGVNKLYESLMERMG